MKITRILTSLLAFLVLTQGSALGTISYSKSGDEDSVRRQLKPRPKGTRYFYQGSPEPEVKPIPVTPVKTRPKPVAPAPRASVNTTLLSNDLYRVQKWAPFTASIGERYDWDYQVDVKQNLKELTITDTIPDGLTYVSSDPEAQVSGDELKWVFLNPKKGLREKIKVVLEPSQRGALTSCFDVAAIPQACLTTKVGVAELALNKTGPANAMVGSNVTYNVTVKNKGDFAAKNVVVTDNVPTGLKHPQGKEVLTSRSAPLPPGKAKAFPLLFRQLTAGNSATP